MPGDYLLRAVATDIHGKTDPAPTAITVTFSETPDVITDLKAKVNGGTVTLTWSSPATGLTGYLLERYDGQGVVTRIAVLKPRPASAIRTPNWRTTITATASRRWAHRARAIWPVTMCLSTGAYAADRGAVHADRRGQLHAVRPDPGRWAR
ncbi:hypothetical protein LP420_39830 [Massilia sp. B-10]|nr:hypothetical protein LP420_39830 [Massilia sp. B-10]